jgi:hypothetical protein
MATTCLPDVLAEPASGQSLRKAAKAATARAFCIRGFVSFVMMATFVLLLMSGVVLFVSPRGRFANWNNWQMLGLDRFQWSALHINVSLLFLVMTVLHLSMNWSRFLGYLRRRGYRGVYLRNELVAAIALSVAIGWAAVANLPPFGMITDLKHAFRDQWEEPTRVNTHLSNSEQDTVASVPRTE